MKNRSPRYRDSRESKWPGPRQRRPSSSLRKVVHRERLASPARDNNDHKFCRWIECRRGSIRRIHPVEEDLSSRRILGKSLDIRYAYDRPDNEARLGVGGDEWSREFQRRKAVGVEVAIIPRLPHLMSTTIENNLQKVRVVYGGAQVAPVWVIKRGGIEFMGIRSPWNTWRRRRKLEGGEDGGQQASSVGVFAAGPSAPN